MKKKIDKRKVFAPLQRYEDQQRALYFSIGAAVAIIGFLIGKFL